MQVQALPVEAQQDVLEASGRYGRPVLTQCLSDGRGEGSDSATLNVRSKEGDEVVGVVQAVPQLFPQKFSEMAFQL